MDNIEHCLETQPPSYKAAIAPDNPQPTLRRMPFPMPAPMNPPPIPPRRTQPNMLRPALQSSSELPRRPDPVIPYNLTLQGSVLPRLLFGPTVMICSSCKNQIISRVEYEISYRTHVSALFLCLFGCVPFIWVPYFSKQCKVPKHYCPVCNKYLGYCPEMGKGHSYHYHYE